jgi:GT2 family glycosyltransferase
VSVVVTSWNGRELLADCLTSLAAQDYPPDRLELIVVDNGSTDGTAEWIRSAWPDVVLVRASENLGFAEGTNLGARAARGELLVFLNNDAAAQPGMLRALVASAIADPGAAAVAARILEWEGDRVEFGGSGLSVMGLGFQHSSWHPTFRETPAGGEIPFACGAAMLVRAEAFRELGGFDAAYFAYYEDVDLGWRMWQSGRRIVYAPEAVIRHRRHATAARRSDRWRHFHWYRNALQTLVKNSETRYLGRLLPLTLATWFSRVGSLYSLAADAYAAGESVAAERQLGCAVGAAEGIGWVLSHFDDVLDRRRAVQARRCVGDAELASRFGLRLDLGPDWDPMPENTLALQLLQLVDLSDLVRGDEMDEACARRMRALRAAAVESEDERRRRLEEEKRLRDALRTEAATAARLHAALHARNQDVQRMDTELHARNREVERLDETLDARNRELLAVRRLGERRDQAMLELEHHLQAVLASRSWRWSAPLRALAARLGRGRGRSA